MLENTIARNTAILKKKKKKGLILLDMSREEWGRSYWLVYRTIFFFFCPIHIFPSSKMKRSNLNILVSILIKIDFFSSLKIGFFCFDYADVILNKSFSRGPMYQHVQHALFSPNRVYKHMQNPIGLSVWEQNQHDLMLT